MNHRLLSILLLSALACPLGVAHAEKADRAKPMNIEADALRHDELKQTKGTIVLRGARLDVRQDADGYQYGVVTGEPGKRAFFRQKRDTLPGAPDEFIEGEGEVIEYDGKADNVKFITRAELRRYRGSVLSDEITGAVIVYNNLTDVFTVDGKRAAPNAAGDKPAPGSRVRAVLAPKDPPPGAAAPAAVPPGSAPVLRPSNSLGGGTQ
jgi:lipopolysaccharide export system protein LptA